jgi:hypothetical protein
MRHHTRRLTIILVALLCLAAVDASAQTRQAAQSVTQADIQRLQDSLYDVERSVAKLRDRDPDLARTLQGRLGDIRDEVTYLRLKFQKEGRVSSAEVADARDRLERVRSQAVGGTDPEARPRGTAGTAARDEAAPERQAPAARANEVPVGAELDVRLQTSLNSGTAEVEDPFEATTLVDLMNGDRVLVPAGSMVRGIVASAERAGRLDRSARLTLTIDRLTIDRRTYPIRATVTEALESGGYAGDAAKIGAGAGVGAIIGGILGGTKGALAGILIGGGGIIAATEGKEVDLPAGTVLRIRMDQPVLVR